MQKWDLVAEPNVQVLADTHTLNEGNKRGDWMKHWLMLQGYTKDTWETNDLQISKKVTRSKVTAREDT